MEANFGAKDLDCPTHACPTQNVFDPNTQLHYTIVSSHGNLTDIIPKTDPSGLQADVIATQQQQQQLQQQQLQQQPLNLKSLTEDELNMHLLSRAPTTFPSRHPPPYKPMCMDVASNAIKESGKLSYLPTAGEHSQPSVYSTPFFTESQTQASSKLYAIAKMVDPQMGRTYGNSLQLPSSQFLKCGKDKGTPNPSNSLTSNEETQPDLRNYTEVNQSNLGDYGQNTDIEMNSKLSNQSEDITNYGFSLDALSKYSEVESVKSEYQTKNTFGNPAEEMKEVGVVTNVEYGNDIHAREPADIKDNTEYRMKPDPDSHNTSYTAVEIQDNHPIVSCVCEEEMANSDVIYTPMQEKGFVQEKGFICGGCSCRFSTICLLHAHVREHGSGGSYHFDHVSQTAFPKYDTFCSYTQTENTHLEDLEITNKPDFNGEEVEDSKHSSSPALTRRSSKKTDEDEKDDDLNDSSKSSPGNKIGGRKRKQDYPKPSKPRMYMIPIEPKIKNKKNLKQDKKSHLRAKKRSKNPKESVAVKVDTAVLTNGQELNSDTDDVEMDSTATLIVENVENLEQTEQNLKSDLKFQAETEPVQEDNPLLAGNKDGIAAISKPFKKRGRARRSDIQGQKAVIVKDQIKNNVTRARKTNKQKHPVQLNESNVEKQVEIDNDIEHFDDQITKEIKDHKKPAVKKKPVKDKFDRFQVCDICGLTVPKPQYVFHMRQHTGERPYICEKCGKSFARSRFLTKHLVTHEEVKPWQCHMCTAQFCQKNEYKMHMAGHAGDRPHQCNVCEMRFLSKTSLLTHQANIHMGLTRFECEVCKRRFFKRSSLNVHQATHFEATLKCSYCDRKFRDKTGLKRHERIHTGVKKFMCHICDHAFIQSTPFWSHMEKRHSMNKVKVKEMLKEIKEVNRRSGIKTEISVLPRAVQDGPDELPEMDLKTDGVSRSSQVDEEAKQSIVDHQEVMAKIQDLVQHNIGQVSHELQEQTHLYKHYPEIKVPTLNVAPVATSEQDMSDLYNQQLDATDSSASMMARHYGFTASTSSSNPTPLQLPSTLSAVDTASTSVSQPINLSNQLHNLSNLPMALQHALSMGGLSAPVSSLHHHGFIGVNTLQQALDYTSSLPQSASYTDISHDRVLNQPQ